MFFPMNELISCLTNILQQLSPCEQIIDINIINYHFRQSCKFERKERLKRFLNASRGRITVSVWPAVIKLVVK